MKPWLQAYQEVVAKWELKPDWKLIEYSQFISKGPVLDLGMGNGRNALFFAKMGFEVDCVDLSKTWVKRCRERASAENLELTAEVADVGSFDIPKRRYALIIASKILQFFKRSELDTIVDRIFAGLARKGVVFLRVFSLEEFEHVRDKEGLEWVEENTYYHARYRLYFHFFTKDEVLSLFPKLKVLSCVEGVGLALGTKGRGYKKPRYQWIIEYMGQRTR